MYSRRCHFFAIGWCWTCRFLCLKTTLSRAVFFTLFMSKLRTVCPVLSVSRALLSSCLCVLACPPSVSSLCLILSLQSSLLSRFLSWTDISPVLAPLVFAGRSWCFSKYTTYTQSRSAASTQPAMLCVFLVPGSGFVLDRRLSGHPKFFQTLKYYNSLDVWWFFSRSNLHVASNTEINKVQNAVNLACM